jgi:saccharopine dehydrogenase (NAD+, L-lysine-forming)
MKIVVLGGAGFVGREVVKDLVKNNSVKEVCIADFNLDVGKTLAKEIGPKVSACFVDITDPSVLLSVVKKYDLAVNTVGPFYRNGARVLEACIAGKTNYVDTCDDYDACDLLLGYDEKCKQAGITAIVSSGASPGITNMVGLYGATQMEQPEEIHTSWVENIGDAAGIVVWWHSMHMAVGEIPQFIDGQWEKVPALTGKVERIFAEPLGKYPVYYLGHPEPVSLPRYIKGLKTVTNRGNIWPADVDLMEFKPLIDFGLGADEILKVGKIEVNRRDFMGYHLMDLLKVTVPPTGDPSDSGDPHFLIRVDISGKIGKSDVHYAYNSHMWDTSMATGTSAAYCAQDILFGKAPKKGAFAPEGYCDPVAFLKYMAERDVCFTQAKTITEPLVFG